jgi:hypothetical protein
MRFLWMLLFCAPIALAQPAIDFSFAGYAGGGESAPFVPGAISVRPTGGDDTALLQAALDRVAALPPSSDGFRGAVLLREGRYRVAGHLEMRAGGVVLRGSVNATIVATGLSRRTLIEIGNSADPRTAPPVSVIDETVPAGARTFTLDSIEGLRPGDRIAITRPSTAAWISALHMTGLPDAYANQRLDWAPGSRNLIWDRTVTAVDAPRQRIAVDAPITTALERRYGGGTVARVASNPPVAHIGVEVVTLESEFDPARPRDDDHSWIALALDRVEDAFVRGVVARHFAGSAVRVGQRARRVTIEVCRGEQPISEPAGYRRQSFLVEGQQVLVRQCAAEQGMNDFASGLLAGGPNVFLDSTANAALGPSGSFESWASGVLYERVRIQGAGIRLANDSSRSQGAGWTAANSVVWNCDAKEIDAHGPEGAENLVNRSPEPLYETQLAIRTGRKLAPPSAILVGAASVPELQPAKRTVAPAPPAAIVAGAASVPELQPATRTAPPAPPSAILVSAASVPELQPAKRIVAPAPPAAIVAGAASVPELQPATRTAAPAPPAAILVSAASVPELQPAKRTAAPASPAAIVAGAGLIPDFHPPKTAAPAPPPSRSPVEIVNGRFVVDGKALWGGVVNEGWWRGQPVPAEALDVGGVSITRFIPGRTGPGVTEDLDALAARMAARPPRFTNRFPDSGTTAAATSTPPTRAPTPTSGLRSTKCPGRAVARAPRPMASASSTWRDSTPGITNVRASSPPCATATAWSSTTTSTTPITCSRSRRIGSITRGAPPTT